MQNQRVGAKTDYLPHVDGLRAIAVFLVLLFHLDFIAFKGGFVGVDVFLVISGFLITRLIWAELERTGKFSFKNFYLRRVRRIAPALLVTLLVSTFFAALLLSPSMLLLYGRSLVTSIFSVSNINFWVESDYFDVSAKMKPLLHTWSLSVEEQFYLFWPPLLVLIFSSRLRRYTATVVCLIGVLSFSINFLFGQGVLDWASRFGPRFQDLISDGKSTIFFLTPFRVFEFLIGGLLVWIPPGVVMVRWLRELLTVVGLICIGLASFFYDESILFPSYYALLPCLGAALVILFGVDSRVASFLRSSLVVRVGLISYSLYLVHWPLIVFWSYSKNGLDFSDKILIILLSILLAYLSYEYVEKTFRYVEMEGQRRWRLMAIAFGLPLILVVCGISMKNSDGWPSRISTEVNFEDMASASSFHRDYYGGSGYPLIGGVETTERPDIVVMGDSHARQYAEGLFKELAKPEQKALYISAGTSCLYLPGFTRTTEGKDWDRLCPKALDRALEFVNNGKSQPIVIVAHSWLAQMELADLLDKDGRRMQKKVDVADVLTGISQLKRRIGSSKLIVIGNVPTANGEDLYEIFSRPKIASIVGPDPSNYYKSQLRETVQHFNEALRAESVRTREFVFLDPIEALCRDGQCLNLDQEKRLIYSDSAHLSKFGSRFVISYFLRDLRSVVAGEKGARL